MYRNCYNNPEASQTGKRKMASTSQHPHGHDYIVTASADMTDISIEPTADMTGISMEPTADMTDIGIEPTADMTGISMEPTADMTDIGIEPTADMTGISMEPTADMTDIVIEPTADERPLDEEAQPMETEPGPSRKPAGQHGQCLNCRKDFVRLMKGYGRTSIKRFCRVDIFNTVFEKTITKEDLLGGFMCTPCLKFLFSKTVRDKYEPGYKRTLPKKKQVRQNQKSNLEQTSPKTVPDKSQRGYKRTLPKKKQVRQNQKSNLERTSPKTVPDKSQRGSKQTLPKKKQVRQNQQSNLERTLPFMTEAMNLLKTYRFRKLLKYLIKHNKKACKAFREVFLELVCTEAQDMRQQYKGKYKGAFGGPVTLARLKEFTWANAIQEADDKAPLLTSVLRSSILPKRRKRAGSLDMLDPKSERWLGMILALVNHSRTNVVCNFVQTMLTVELWKRGFTQEMSRTFSRLGVTQTLESAKQCIEECINDCDRPVHEWKAKLESVESNVALGETGLTYPYPYSICWSSVQFGHHVKVQHFVRKPDALPWTLPFAYSSRVPCKYLKRTGTIPACQLVANVLPDTSEGGDLASLMDLMVHLVMRILTKNLPFLEELKEFIPSMQHKFSQEMCRKTQVVSLGVLEVHPTSTDGVETIMDHLHTYVPHIPYVAHKHWKGLLPILCGGDSRALEKMVHAKRARANGETETAKLQGLVECPQEHHKEKILLQDTLNMLYSERSSAARGTLSDLKNFYKANLRKMKPDAKLDFKHSYDLVEFSTESYITLFAMTATNMQTVSDLPASFPRHQLKWAERLQWLRNLAWQIVEFCWMGPTPEDIQRVASSTKSEDSEGLEQGGICVCAQDVHEDLVQCCSYQCPTSWFHLSCVNLQEPPDSNWFCSKRCKDDGTYIYCTCHRRKGGQMVQCGLGGSCRGSQWYHTSCLQQKSFPEKWYCSEECSPDTPDDDFVQNYSKALMWRGLNHLARRFAVNHGDGERMKSHWKLDLLDFWNYGHRLDLQIAQHFLTGASGFYPKRLAEDIIWNRVANLSGTEGENVGLDLVNQFLHEEFKEMVLKLRGRYTDQQHVERAAKMTGTFSREIARLVGDSSMGNYMRPKSRSNNLYKKYILDFLAKYRKDGLFDYMPGRQHAGFEQYKYNVHLRYPGLLGRKLKKYAKEMDTWKELTE